MISATENPSKLLRTWPRCNGLFVFGEEYSTKTAFSSLVLELYPKVESVYIELKKLR